MRRFLQSPAFVCAVGCFAYLATTAALVQPAHFARARQVERRPLSPNEDPSWRFRNPEFEQWLEELSAERHALEVRERQLADLEARLQAERAEILATTQAVHRLQVDFDRTVLRFKAQETENLKRQTKIVAGMSPEGAAAMLRELPEPEFVRILFALKPDQASAILDALSRLGGPDAQLAARAADSLRRVFPDPADTRGTP